ncbi:hypothetical protein AGOR_G00151400 [Albula goreensis]|uniref:Fork-head domain-containing protein n=1 Tax=Albula goreensis TaxID=1534307 RepID=A0A8T3D3M5_9TELE|nr:hypothetical protein AGOR_G00151400 [Albula goreensis]
MPRNDGEKEGCEGSSRGHQQQVLEKEVSLPILFGPRGSFITASQLQVILLQQCGTKEGNKQLFQLSQYRPSVLRSGAQAVPQDYSSAPASGPTPDHAPDPSPSPACKVEASVDTSHTQQHTGHAPWPRQADGADPKLSSACFGQIHSPSPPSPEGGSVLFVNGLCRWPGCKAMFQEYSSFLKHLRMEHRPGDRSASQWRMQRDVVQHMETQLCLEKQRLLAMQLHLHLPEQTEAYSMEESEGESSGAISSHVSHKPPLREKVPLLSHSYWNPPTAQPLPGLIPSIECFKYNNIRPPYTYAHLIRWAILESPDKQLTLSEIYHWFTRMFFYFRHNTATWKNAVRHNLSLHKCFVRVEGGKGAVWTVDEAEFQKRKGQKFSRDQDMTWLAPYSLLYPQEIRAVGQTGSH